MTIQLRPYQDAMIVGAREQMMAAKKCILLQAPCGSGKTVLAGFMTKNTIAKGHGVMFLTHREELALQASRTYSRIGVMHGLIMAGITPDYRKIAQVAMIDTLRNRLDRVRVPKVIIVDEAHHAVSPSWKKVIDHFTERGAIVIGLSATPQRLDGRGLSDVFESIVLGPSVRDLIDAGALCDYEYYAPPSFVDTTEMKIKFGDFNKQELELATDKPQIIGDAISHYQRLLSGKRAIAFAVSIAHSQHIAAQFNAAGIPAAHVDGETPTGERKRIINNFAEGRISVMSNVSLFGEGFDVPACEGVIILRATASLALHIQICGRAMRPHDGKARAVIIDHVGNVIRHGLPDEDREWSLEGKEKKKGKKKNADEINIKQCPKCYTAHVPAPTCPRCGHIYESSTQILEQVDGELQAVTPEMREAMRRAKLREQGRAQSVEELIALGHNRYAAERIISARAEKQEIISGITADLTAWQEKTGEMPYPIFGVSYRDIRYMKPRELRELRERFEAHKAEHTAAKSVDCELELS